MDIEHSLYSVDTRTHNHFRPSVVQSLMQYNAATAKSISQILRTVYQLKSNEKNLAIWFLFSFCHCNSAEHFSLSLALFPSGVFTSNSVISVYRPFAVFCEQFGTARLHLHTLLIPFTWFARCILYSQRHRCASNTAVVGFVFVYSFLSQICSETSNTKFCFNITD